MAASNNARACFRSAAIQDADAESHEYSADFALLDYLDGFVTARLSGDGSDAFSRAEKEARLAKPPQVDLKANVLLFVESGMGPYKFSTGKYNEELRFGIQPSPAVSAAIAVNGQRIQIAPYDDLYFQATTRGGRVMDHVLGNKAAFKSTTDAIGTTAIIGGAVAASSRNRTSQEVGLGLIAAGILTEIISGATTPAADVRAWTNLPRYLSFAALSLPTGQHTATVEFFDQAGRVLPDLTKTITINVPSDGKDKVIFVSDKSITPQTV